MNFQELYKKNGYLYKFKAIDAADAQKLIHEFDKNYKYHLKPSLLIKEELFFKIHLLYKSFNEIIKNRKILDIVEDILGKNIVCWNSLLFYKKKSDFVSFHQDLKYWKFLNDNNLTVSLALTKSTKENGCLAVVPESHKVDEVHLKGPSRHNLLANSQSINVENKEKKFLELDPGEFSIHHGNIIHGSYENKTNDHRVLLSIRYASDDNISKIYKTATYITEKKNAFLHEPVCKINFDKECIEFREKLLQNQYQDYFKRKFKILSKIRLYKFASNKIIRLIYCYFFK